MSPALWAIAILGMIEGVLALILITLSVRQVIEHNPKLRRRFCEGRCLHGDPAWTYQGKCCFCLTSTVQPRHARDSQCD